MDSKIKNIIDMTEGLNAEGMLKVALNVFGERIAQASSFGAEDQVITHMLSLVSPQTRVFTLDTGRLAEQTYETIEATRTRYGIEIELLFPDRDSLEEITALHGPNMFRDSVEKRKLCCKVRKVEPLKRKLAQLDAWICGLRSEQSVTRKQLQRIEWDQANGLIKISPLADWTNEQVWQYIHENDIPYNRLHDEGYPSIGCEPCTRAVEPGGDIRSGRWWWEEPQHKECGLHVGPSGKLTRRNENGSA